MIFCVGITLDFERHLLDHITTRSLEPGGMLHNITDSALCNALWEGGHAARTVARHAGYYTPPSVENPAPEVFKIQVPGLVGFWEGSIFDLAFSALPQYSCQSKNEKGGGGGKYNLKTL